LRASDSINNGTCDVYKHALNGAKINIATYYMKLR